MKTIAIYFTKPGAEDTPFDDPSYREAYQDLSLCFEEKGGRCAIVRDPATYRGDGVFDGGWEFRETDLRRIDGPVRADVIFNKGRGLPDDGTPMVNDSAFDALCTDKSRTYDLLSDLCPKTFTVRSAEERDGALKRIPGDMAVGKPLDREGGGGVVIGPKEKVRSGVTEFPYLIQEFLDTSGGIPGIAPGKHDFRMISLQGRLLLTLLRTPKEGSYLANASQGGSIHEIPLAHLPAEARALFETVDARLAAYKTRFYSLDAARNQNGEWRIIELNAQPGLLIHDKKADGHRYHGELAEFLLSVANG